MLINQTNNILVEKTTSKLVCKIDTQNEPPFVRSK